MFCEASQAAAGAHAPYVPRALRSTSAVSCGLRILRHPTFPRVLQFPRANEAARLLRC
jgi:hypothetical protein